MSDTSRRDSSDSAAREHRTVQVETGRLAAPAPDRGDPRDRTSRQADWQFRLEPAERRFAPLNVWHAPPLVKAFLIGGLLVAGAAIVSFLTDADVDMLKVGEESNLPTWYSASQLFTIGLVTAALAYRDSRGPSLRSRMLVAVPGLFFFLSLDEIAMIHERLGAWLQTLGVGTEMRTGPWMFIFAPLVAVLGGIALWSLWPYLRKRRTIVVLGFLGGALFGFSAVGLEFLANFAPAGSYQQKAFGFAEEYGEMLAGSLLLWSAVLTTRAEGIHIEFGSGPKRPA